jgi:H+/Cl- antiporter ClcA
MTGDDRHDDRSGGLVADLRNHLDVAIYLLRWIALGTASGAMAGVASFALLKSLDRVTDLRLDHSWLVFLLPPVALVVGFVYHRWGGRSGAGNGLLLDEIHEPTEWVPRRMAPLVFVATIVAHLFGASVGREGTALQMSGSLTDGLSRLLRIGPADRRLLLIAALAGGFGSVFGVPLAGAVFALEVQAVGRVRYEALVPALTASIVGDLVVHGLGYDHPVRVQLDLPLEAGLLLKVALAGIAFGLVSTAFTALSHAIESLHARWVPWPPARLAIGAIATVALVGLVGHEYLGLSLPLIDDTLLGVDPGPTAFALKLLFTAIALGSGIPGGEVTPLFVIGATLGGALAGPLGLDVGALGAIGFVGVFAGAANVPLACTIMGVELFGSGTTVPMAVGCVVAYVFSSHRGIYATQRIDIAKGRRSISGLPRARDGHAGRHRPADEP